VDNYYATVFDPALERGTGGSADAGLFRPTSNAQTYLQSLYKFPHAGAGGTALP